MHWLEPGPALPTHPHRPHAPPSASFQICCSFGVDVLEALAASCTQLAAGWDRRAAYNVACDVLVASLLLSLHGATLMSQVGGKGHRLGVGGGLPSACRLLLLAAFLPASLSYCHARCACVVVAVMLCLPTCLPTSSAYICHLNPSPGIVCTALSYIVHRLWSLVWP